MNINFGPLPNNLDAEREILGSVLTDNALFSHAKLSMDDFYDPAHQYLWRAISVLIAKGSIASVSTLMAIVDPTGERSEAGRYLSILPGATYSPTREMVEANAEEIRGLSHRRTMIQTCEEHEKRYREVGVHETPAEITASLCSVAQSTVEPDSQQTYRGALEQLVADLSNPAMAYSTGIPELDRAMGGRGLIVGKSYGFAARKKKGKTILACTLSYNFNQAGVPHLFIAAEMSPLELVHRMASRHLRVNPNCFLQDPDPRLKDALANYAVTAPDNLVFEQATGLTFDRLRRTISQAALAGRVRGVILDYYQLVGGRGPKESESSHLDEVAQYLADCARKYGIWVIAMAQLNQTDNTRGGEGIRLAFDQVYTLHREGDGNSPDAWLEMTETRYTPWVNVGGPARPGLIFQTRGLYFEGAVP